MKKHRGWLSSAFCCLVLLLLMLPVNASAAPVSFAYVTNAGAESVSVVNTATNAVVGTVPVGITPEAAAANPDGSRVYVANNLAGTVSAIDTSTNTAVATIPVPFPSGIAFLPDGSLAYVSAQMVSEVGPAVQTISTATNSVASTIPVGTCPAGVAAAPSGSLVYVVNACSDNVSVIDTATNLVVTSIPVGEEPWGIALSPSGTTAYVTNEGSDSVSVVNTASNAVETTVPVGEGPSAAVVTPDDAAVYVSNTASNTVSVINTATNSVVGTIPVGLEPRGIASTPDGSTVYVANQESNALSLIDTATNAVVGTVPVGDQPMGIAITPPIEGSATTGDSDSAPSSSASQTANSASSSPPPAMAAATPHKSKPLKCRKGFSKRRVHGKARCVRRKSAKRQRGHAKARLSTVPASASSECLEAGLARPAVIHQLEMHNAGIRPLTPGHFHTQGTSGWFQAAPMPEGCAATTIRAVTGQIQMQRPGSSAWVNVGGRNAVNRKGSEFFLLFAGPTHAWPDYLFNECAHGHWLKVRGVVNIKIKDSTSKAVIRQQRYSFPASVHGSCREARSSKEKTAGYKEEWGGSGSG